MSKSADDIIEMIEKYEESVKALKAQLYKMAWYMRGGLTISEIFMTSEKDRSIIIDLINENFKNTKDTGIPFI